MNGSHAIIWRYKAWSVRWQVRRLGLNVFCFALLLTSVALALMLGKTMLTAGELLQSLTADAGAHAFLVQELRLPRAAAGAVVGAALGASGLLLQTLTRNRLASPDLLGISEGATLAMGLSLLWTAENMLGAWWLALLGGLGASGLVLTAAGGVGAQGHRVLVVGMGLAAVLRALFDVLLATLPVMHSTGIYTFSLGSLLGRGYDLALPAAGTLLVVLLILTPMARGLGLLALGTDTARSLGVRSGALGLAVLLIAGVLAGIGVSIAGPVGFVAIAAPILTRELFGHVGTPIGAAMALGGAMVLAADTIGRVWLPPLELAAGAITGVLGGPLLLWLLLRHRNQGD